MQYLNARYYDPRLAMFLQPDWWDPTKPGVGTNRYAYSFNDPVNGKDPSGHWANPSEIDCGNCKKTPKGGYSSEVNPERKRVQFATKGCPGCTNSRVYYEKRPRDLFEYGLHAQSRMGLVAAKIDDPGLDPNAEIKAYAELATMAFAVSDLYKLGRLGLAGWEAAATTLTTAARALGTAGSVGGKYSVYGSVVNGVPEYIGMTENLVNRAAQHLRSPGRIIEPIATGLSKFEARALEQVLIERTGLANLTNKINSIARSNPSYDEAIDLGTRLGSELGLW